MQRNLLEKLAELSPGMEIWWDSSPLIFEDWCAKISANVSAEKRRELQGHFNRMQIPSQPLDQLFRGVTTNPSLSLQAINSNPPFWTKVTQQIIHENPGIGQQQLYWELYKTIVKRGSDMYMPLFESSHYTAGFISGQVDPRFAFDKKQMLVQAEELASINPNVMIKIPGTNEGYEVIEVLTSKAIPTNNTATFVLSQLIDCAETVKKGVETAKKNGVDLSRWRSVITMMESRFSDYGGLRDMATEQGIDLSEGELRLAELAIFKKAYRYLKKNKLPSKMLSCSLRVGPEVDGVTRVWHLEEKTGADIVVTCPPTFIEQLLLLPDQDKIILQKNRIDEEIPQKTLKKLMQIPYFQRSYAEDGYNRAEYGELTAMKTTIKGFSRDTEEMVAFAGLCLEKYVA